MTFPPKFFTSLSARAEALYAEVTKHWFDIQLHHDIGYVQHAEAIKGSMAKAGRAKVKAYFEGNVVDLGSKYSLEDLTAIFYPRGGGKTTFNFPAGRKLRIMGCATKEDPANPIEFIRQGEPCFIVGKDGNTTDLTVGLYAGLVFLAQIKKRFPDADFYRDTW
ncbi:hypothetical protein DXG03_009186 [Asterophora parasitica]|uniref:Uncharacterized protein n=1 Tax=Asterophora parasitica TaxID=117018 RepID=A0A9P7G539_9AGAR|nr:hypothetical protein DXG03_009186 [Asterophora parasitica]